MQRPIEHFLDIHVELAPHLLSPYSSSTILYLRHYKSPTALLDIHHLT